MADDWVIGALYRLAWSEAIYRLEEIKPKHCQLHGEYLGVQLVLRRKRNSTSRPWGHSIVLDGRPGVVTRVDNN